MGKMTCPICGSDFDDTTYIIDDRGNPICPQCAALENDENTELKNS